MSHDAATVRVTYAAIKGKREPSPKPCESAPQNRIIIFARSDEPLAYIDTSIDAEAFEAELARQSLPPYSHIVPAPVPRDSCFYGRKEELDWIRQHSGPHARHENIATTLVWGSKGLGKTSLAVEFAQKSRPNFDVILMLTMETKDQVVSDFSIIANLLKLKKDEEAPGPFSAAKLVLDWLSHRDGAWLLIFDDVQSADLLKEYSPQTGNGSILVLSRGPYLEPHLTTASCMKLAPFNPEEGSILLMRLTGNPIDLL